MKNDSRFRDAPGAAARTMRLRLDGRWLTARAGESVAAALLAQDGAATRSTPVSGAGRTPYCMMGVCFDCLVTIDGRQNQQACMTEVRDGMVVERQQGARRTAAVS